MKSIVEMRDKLRTYLGTAQSILDGAIGENRSLTTAEQKDLDGLNEKIDALQGTVKRHDMVRDRMDSLNATLPHPGEGIPGPRAATRNEGDRRILHGEQRMAEAVRGSYPAEQDQLSFGKCVRGFVTGNWDGADGERRAMAEGTLGAGGAMVPTPLTANLIDLVRNQAVVMRAGAGLIPMESGTLKMARLKTDPTAAWTAENASITASDGEFELVTFTAQKLAAMIKCSIELIEDAPNMSAVIERSFAQVLSLELDRVALYGSGTAPEPKGLAIYANTVVPEVLMGANGATVASYDQLSEAYFTVVGNNNTPHAAVYAPRTAKQLDQLKEASTNAPLAAPESWRGLNKLVSNQVSITRTQGTATAQCSDVFVGDFSGMAVGSRTNLVLEASRTAGDAFKDGQVWIRAYLRADIQLLRPRSFCVLRGLKA